MNAIDWALSRALDPVMDEVIDAADNIAARISPGLVDNSDHIQPPTLPNTKLDPTTKGCTKPKLWTEVDTVPAILPSPPVIRGAMELPRSRGWDPSRGEFVGEIMSRGQSSKSQQQTNSAAKLPFGEAQGYYGDDESEKTKARATTANMQISARSLTEKLGHMKITDTEETAPPFLKHREVLTSAQPTALHDDPNSPSFVPCHRCGHRLPILKSYLDVEKNGAYQHCKPCHDDIEVRRARYKTFQPKVPKISTRDCVSSKDVRQHNETHKKFRKRPDQLACWDKETEISERSARLKANRDPREFEHKVPPPTPTCPKADRTFSTQLKVRIKQAEVESHKEFNQSGTNSVPHKPLTKDFDEHAVKLAGKNKRKAAQPSAQDAVQYDAPKALKEVSEDWLLSGSSSASSLTPQIEKDNEWTMVEPTTAVKFEDEEFADADLLDDSDFERFKGNKELKDKNKEVTRSWGFWGRK